MKKIFSLLIALSIILSFAAVPASAHTDSTPTTSWKARVNNQASVSIVTAETANVSGLSITGNALQLKVDSTGTGSYVYVKTAVSGIKNGKTYRLTGKIHSARAINDSNSSLLLTADTNYENNTTYRISNLSAAVGEANTWKDVDYTFTNSKPDTYNYLTFALTASGTTILDDLSLKEVQTDENGVTRYSEELIKNGDFDYVAPATATANQSEKLTGVNGWGESLWYVASGKSLDASVELLTDIIGTPEGRGMLKLRAGGATSDYDSINASAVQNLSGLDTTKTYLLTGKVKANSNNTFVKLTNATVSSYTQGTQGINIIEGLKFTNGTWGDLKLEFTPTDSTVKLSFKAQANRTMYLDNLSVKAIEKDTEGNIVKYSEELLVNGNFEDSFDTGMEAGTYWLENVAGWDTLSNWNIPADGYKAGIDLLENIVGAPEGNNMLKIWAGAPTGTANLNAKAIQQINVTKDKKYRLTGKIKFNSNNTYIYLGNTDFNNGSQVMLTSYFGEGKNGIWNDVEIDFTASNDVVELRFTAAANRNIYIDDLSVKEILGYDADNEAIVGDTEYLINGDFEGAEIVVPVFEATKAFYPSEDGEVILDETPQESLTAMIDEYGVEYVCAHTDIANTKYTDKDVTVYLAVYENERLCDVVLSSTEVQESGTVNVFYKLPDLSDTETTYSFKLFVWNEDLVPAGDCGEIAE